MCRMIGVKWTWFQIRTSKNLAIVTRKKNAFATNILTIIFCFFFASDAIANRAHLKTNIEDDFTNQRLKEALTGIMKLQEGKIGKIVSKFSEEDSNGLWKLKEGTLPKNMNAATIQTTEGTLVTIFDYNKLQHATELSLARTVIHELVHTYLVLYFRFDAENALQEYPQMIHAWQSTPDPNLNEIHHAEMVISYVDDIALALKEYALSLGLDLEDSLYKALAWGGLDFHESEHLAEENKVYIQQRLDAERFGLPANTSG